MGYALSADTQEDYESAAPVRQAFTTGLPMRGYPPKPVRNLSALDRGGKNVADSSSPVRNGPAVVLPSQTHISPRDAVGSKAHGQRTFHLRLVSDATSETVLAWRAPAWCNSKACSSRSTTSSLIRTPGRSTRSSPASTPPRPDALHPGQSRTRVLVHDHCRRLPLPCVRVLDPVMSVLAVHFHPMKSSRQASSTSSTKTTRPHRRHELRPGA